MSRGIQAFKQTDLTKAIRGTRNAGIEPRRVEISRDGRIVIITSGPDTVPTATNNENENEWDTLK